MGIPWILQRYIFREMRNTFLLTAIALTGVLSLGGGVLNMIKLGEVTPGQFLRLMGLVLPVAVALTLPIAALFSASATYGRISGDNEFVACRSSGINLHVLLLPTVLLSLVSAVITFAFVSFVIPRMVRNLNEFLSADVVSLIEHRIQRPRGLTLGGKYRIHADDVLTSPEEPSRVTLLRVAFVEVEGREWVRFGTAEQVDLLINQSDEQIQVSGAMSGLSFFDRNEGRFADSGEEVFPRVELPALVPPQIKFLTWTELQHYKAHSHEWPEVREALAEVRSGQARREIIDALLATWSGQDRRLVLGGEGWRLEIQADGAARIPNLGGIEFAGVELDERRGERVRRLTTDRAVLEVKGGFPDSIGVTIEFRPDRPRADGKASVASKETLGPFPPPGEPMARLASMASNDWLTETTGLAADDTVDKLRQEAREVQGEVQRRIVGTLHERLAFSVSVLVLVVLGGALGIILRGSHVLTAFGISFIPLVVVIIAIVAGRQMSHNAATQTAGLAVMWGGIGLVALVDLWTIGRILRR